ncbi:pyrrolo-quinoline quinone [Arcticibacterium luteifluviistationis]|uniref:Pyrrolo-quinoline quinone n=1 Tax=Arcticibacterium luteifluviistationis TaxID=1784714 RepID=A0A2Z4GHP1_9BACT|nr:pyrrolo-quinoline quinone [Arcticibacterium luteifluviistationis]
MFSVLVLFSFGIRPPAKSNWPGYNGGDDRNHFSSQNQINTENVKTLKEAWRYASGGADGEGNRTQMQCNPIIIDGILFGVSAASQAFAIDAKTGKEIWKTDIQVETFNMTSRGLTYWSDKKESRIFFGYGAYLYGLDAKTGKPIKSFGDKGKIYLVDGIRRPGADEYVAVNTPVAVYKNTLIVGSRLAESSTALLGDIRAFDAISGKLIWTFHTIPKPDEYGYDTWENDNYQNLGGANNWMGMAVDVKRGIVFAPTGSAAFDFYGGNRKGDNLFANCLIALDAKTGKRLWHFQTVHHDIWDRDIPAPPNLFSIHKDGKKLDVVSVLSKQGFVFVFDRETGKPVFPIEERAFPTSIIPGEISAPTQPIPLIPEPFTRQSFTEKDISYLAENKEEIRDTLRNSYSGQPFIPLGFKKTIFYPGTDGGAQWGGAAVDENAVMYIPAKQNPVYSSLRAVTKQARINTGKTLYTQNCQTCHGLNAEGNEDGTIPGILNLSQRMKRDKYEQILKKGRGRMPSFSQISDIDKKAILNYLNGQNETVKGGSGATATEYVGTGYNRWYDSNGYPVSNPPWGTLTAINMNSGKHLWQVPLGEYPELTARGIPLTGTDNYGGPAVTSGNLLFIAATKDELFRAFDRRTGGLLWQAKLPAAGYASASVYAVDGKQYVVIACGGGKLKTQSGDFYVAFALP